MSHVNNSRITYKSVNPNPMLIKWLEEFKDSNTQYSVKEAINSLKKYPLSIESAEECAILKGFDKVLCSYLDRKLKEHKNVIISTPSSSWHSDENVPSNIQSSGLNSAHSTKDNTNSKKKCEKRAKKPYKPAFRTGGYAILIALFEHVNKNPTNLSLTKDQLIGNAQQHCEESLTRPKPDSRYTAWATMSSLISRGFVNKTRKKKVEYSLTDEGFILASELHEMYKHKPAKIDILGNHFDESTLKSLKSTNKKGSDYSSMGSASSNCVSAVMDSEYTKDVPSTSKYTGYSGSDYHSFESSQSSLDNKKDTIEILESHFDFEYQATAQYNCRKNNIKSNNVDVIELDDSDDSSEIKQNDNDLNVPKADVIEIEDDDDKVYTEAVKTSISDNLASLVTDIDGSDDVIEMCAGSYDIILLIDKQETSGAARKDDPIVIKMNKYDNLKHEYRHLKLGDFTWVAKHKTSGAELVLPFIIERKRMDDLGASIKDGRFHEQKYRLKRCGLKNVIYLVENYGKNKNVGLPIESLMQAISNTQFQDGFTVHMTDSLSGSVMFLAIMTRRLILEYENKSLKGSGKESTGEYLMTFDYFNKASAKSKPLTIRQAFIKMLLQLKGMSLQKAVAITDVYGTPSHLIEKYNTCSEKEGEMLLAKLKFDETSQCVGPNISKILYKFFTLDILP